MGNILLGRLVALAARLGDTLLGLFLAGLALRRLRDHRRGILAAVVLLLRLLVGTLDVRVRWRDTACRLFFPLLDNGRADLVPGGVDDARPRLILSLELDLALERLDLLLVEQVPVLVAVLDPLLLRHHLVALGLKLGCARDGLLRGLVLIRRWWLLCCPRLRGLGDLAGRRVYRVVCVILEKPAN